MYSFRNLIYYLFICLIKDFQIQFLYKFKFEIEEYLNRLGLQSYKMDNFIIVFFRFQKFNVFRNFELEKRIEKVINWRNFQVYEV